MYFSHFCSWRLYVLLVHSVSMKCICVRGGEKQRAMHQPAASQPDTGGERGAEREVRNACSFSFSHGNFLKSLHSLILLHISVTCVRHFHPHGLLSFLSCYCGLFPKNLLLYLCLLFCDSWSLFSFLQLLTPRRKSLLQKFLV